MLPHFVLRRSFFSLPPRRLSIAPSQHESLCLLPSDSTSISPPASVHPLAVGDLKQRALAAISLLKSETDPSRILTICRSAYISPDHHLGRAALSVAVSSLSSSPRHLRSFLAPLLHSGHHLPHAISLFGQAGLLDDAIAAFRLYPSLRSLNSLLFACILSNKHRRAGEFFRDFPVSYRIKPNIVTYNTVTKAFCESGGSRAFYSYLDEMVRKGIKPNLTTFSIALAGFYREERSDDVKKVLWLMKKHGRHAGLSIYNIRIQSLCKLGRPDEAKELLREMRVRRRKPNCETYDHLVLGYCCIGNLDEAKKVFKEMGRRGIAPQSSCYFTLVHYLCKGGDFASAFEVCRESMERNWVPRFSTMKVLVDGLVSTSQVSEAREILGMVKGKFSRNAELWEKINESLPI
ncbi:pentatricopeptide repeat-containing protein At1g61870, mitochondrial-like [Phalaenopsis equestris]|uniref:pentatricopeptide repeat-containing protein At1g61870, mitochondrial-like n=1 Tax=Phalaenopsis equestris TaxID=78828 RepID=UPI0009E25596|nr:pentatricopeptide repeat-containing protein At1g61870, mitochondrial-like [Phalaenopsis equestris]XP_020591339.1 pentatricopeptide repeat-containing protein At1g61870, mitochondrial-like [Phalaenopsis equestris]XP_020591340.1 pentatricopeptide repeat-containing protein At1g61870, mitochondrial-like [Phalaenopsis equestris]